MAAWVKAHWILVAVILASPVASVFSQEDAARLGEDQDGLLIERVQHLAIQDKEPSHDKLVTGAYDKKFSDVIDLTLPIDADTRVHWLKLTVGNTTPYMGDWILEFDNWVYVDAYIPDGNEMLRLRSGHFLPYDQRDYAAANKPLIRIPLESSEVKSLYVRLESSINYLQVPQNLLFEVYSQEVFEKQESNRRFALGLFTGFYVIMLLYNLFIYFSTRDANYIPYLVALLAATALTFHNAGYTVSLFSGFENYVHLHSKMQFFLSQVLGISMLIFAAWFLDVRNRYPRYYKVLIGLVIVILFLPVPSFFGYTSVNDKISGLLGILSMIFILTLAIKSYRDKYPSSGLFLSGYGAFAVGIVTILSTFIGVLPMEVQDYYPMNIGSTIEMVFFSLALGNRINVLAKDNEEKQRQIIDQLREKEELQVNINRELEVKVADRTKEIEMQKVLLEQEKEKSDGLLRNILPASVADELKEKGEAEPKSFENVSVLFADLVGFTKRAESMTPVQIIDELDYCFQAFDEIVERNGLEKIKTLGDGYMCAGGVPVADPGSTLRTVSAAMDIRAFIDGWEKEKLANGEEPWQVRIGIHTGEVIAGVVGKNKFAYDIWGDTVNTASRIETACEPGRVNISGATFEHVKEQVKAEFRGKIIVKEKEVDMYYVTGFTENT